MTKLHSFPKIWNGIFYIGWLFLAYPQLKFTGNYVYANFRKKTFFFGNESTGIKVWRLFFLYEKTKQRSYPLHCWSWWCYFLWHCNSIITNTAATDNLSATAGSAAFIHLEWFLMCVIWVWTHHQECTSSIRIVRNSFVVAVSFLWLQCPINILNRQRYAFYDTIFPRWHTIKFHNVALNRVFFFFAS